MKASIFLFLFFFVSCSQRLDMHKYNTCTLYKEYSSDDSLFSFHINISDYKLSKSKISSDSILYGLFKGVSRYNQKPYNFIVLNSFLTEDSLKKVMGNSELIFESYQKSKCIDFYSAVTLEEFLDKGHPVLVGELRFGSNTD